MDERVYGYAPVTGNFAEGAFGATDKARLADAAESSSFWATRENVSCDLSDVPQYGLLAERHKFSADHWAY